MRISKNLPKITCPLDAIYIGQSKPRAIRNPLIISFIFCGTNTSQLAIFGMKSVLIQLGDVLST